ncbi:MAG TPA: type II toxin-antitoxin system prevent-host-death family antitoxin [Myxococcales bacterium]|nr:type II toxin-antitoxin system prevent-host-death family antitoxin [Myxococcales bacterium]
MSKRRIQVNIYEAKTRLSALVDQAAAGHDVIIGRAGKPVARLTRLEEPKRKVRFGGLKGKFKVPDDFDAPLPDSVLAAFAGD